jgi:hypothetical protein
MNITLVIEKVLYSILMLSGLGMLWYYSGWQVALGVFLFSWGYGMQLLTTIAPETFK